MTEYIDRNTAIAKVTALEVVEPLTTMVDVKRLLADMPAADVAPVRHGRWEWREKWDIDEPNHNSTLEYCGWYCSHCGIELGEYMTTSTDEKHYLDDDIREPLLNYCPNCGAKMDGGADNG